MKLSFVVPTYNCKTYVQECLASIQDQTMQDFECIVVDDESTDGTYEWCLEASASDSRIKPVQQKHSWAASCRNRGIDMAQGEYVWIVDSDDLIAANAAEQTLDFIEANSLQMAMIDGEAFSDGANMFSLMHSISYLHRKVNYGIASGQEVLRRMVDNLNFNCYVFLQVIRRDAIRHKFPIIALDEDMVYTIQNLANLERVGHLPKALYRKRCRSKSTLTSAMTLDKTISLLDAIDLVLDWTAEELERKSIDASTAECIERQLEIYALEIRTRFKRLGPDELRKVEALPFKRQARLKILSKDAK